jgi:hypothetical protein
MLRSLHRLKLSLRYACHLQWRDEAAGGNPCLHGSRNWPWGCRHRHPPRGAVLRGCGCGCGKLPGDVETSGTVGRAYGSELRSSLGARGDTGSAWHLTRVILLLQIRRLVVGLKMLL